MVSSHGRSSTYRARRSAWPSLSPLALIRAIFTHHVRIKRATRGLVVVLEPEPEKANAAAKRTPLHRDKRALEMHAALGAALDAAPGSRNVLRHLATVEHHLWKNGSLFIQDLPLPVLARTRDQLEGVIKPPFANGAKLLRNCLAEAVATQERLERERELRQPPSSFLVDHKLVVHEAEASDFERATDERATESPALWAS